MFRTIVIVAALGAMSVAAFGAAQASKPSSSIEVTAPKDLAAVNGLNDALTALSEKVTACAKTAKKPETCQCSYPQELKNLRTRYADVVRLHPDWKDQLLSYQRLDKEGRKISGALNLEGLRRQLDMLKCE